MTRDSRISQAPPRSVTRRDLLLFGSAGLLGGALTWRAMRPPEPPAGRLSASEAFERASAGEITLIDIRRPDEWTATGVGSVAHPLDLRRPDFNERLADIAQPGRPIALICARGVRSARLASALREAGFTQIIDVPEGMIGSAAGPGWIAAGLPLSQTDGDQ